MGPLLFFIPSFLCFCSFLLILTDSLFELKKHFSCHISCCCFCLPFELFERFEKDFKYLLYVSTPLLPFLLAFLRGVCPDCCCCDYRATVCFNSVVFLQSSIIAIHRSVIGLPCNEYRKSGNVTSNSETSRLLKPLSMIIYENVQEI